MKKKIKLLSKLLSIFLALVLATQLAPMQVLASIYQDLTTNENTDNALGVSLDDIDTVQPEAKVIAEDNSKREQSVKHFLMSDGSYKAAQYDVPVHFMQDNEWTDYDNTLVEVDADSEDGESASNKDLTNVLADYSVRLSKKTNGKKFVRIEKDGHKLSWYYTKANKVSAQITEITDDGDETTLEKLSSQIIYEDVYIDTDFEYIVSSEGLKENIILKDRGTQTVFEAEYKANGLTPVQINDKTIELRADDGTAIYVISAPYMRDANGEISNGITLSLSNIKNDKFKVITTLDEDWLNELGREYPVTVDPVIQTKQEYQEMDSTFVGSSYPDRCYYTYGNANGGIDSGSIYVGNIYGYGQTESYLKVNLLPQIGVADKVVYAQLNMGLVTCELGMQLDVKQVTEPWEMDEVTWRNKPDSGPSIEDYIVLKDGESSKFISFEITDLVRGWYSGEYANYGVSFSTSKTSSAKVWMFSSDFNEYGLDENRPILYVGYRNMSGYEDYWSYTGISAGRGGAVSVNNYNGNAVFSQPITLGDGGNLMPVSISLVYNSNGDDALYSLFGAKMRTNFHLHIKREENTKLYDAGYRYYLVDADGTKHWFYFENSTTKTGKDEDGLGYTLDVITKGSDTTCTDAIFRLTDKDKTKMYFNSENKLIQVTNTNGISIKVTYSTNPTLIKTIIDGAGRVYTFNYEDTANPRYCTSITDPAGRKTSFTYNSTCLTSITFPDGKQCTLQYGNYFVKKINSFDGTRAQIVYDTADQNRVQNINWGTSDTDLLESYSFEYKQNETTITERVSAEKNRKYTYQFNDFGQTTGIVSNESGMAQYFEYTTPEKVGSANANKLVSESKIIHSVANYIKNPGVVNALSGTYSTTIGSSSGTPTITQDTTKGNLTKNSLKVYKPSSNTSYVYALQNHTGLSAGTYTFSCYANTFGGTTSGKGLYVGYRILNSSGTIVKSGSAENINTTDGWERISVTFDLEANQTVRVLVGFSNGSSEGSGTVWFDDFQLEKSAGPSSYNMIENSNLNSGLASWEGTASLVYIDDLPGFTRAISSVGSPTDSQAGFSQYIYPLNGKKGDVFSIGSWIKAESAPINNLKENDAYSPSFSLALHFYNSSGGHIKAEKIAVNDDLKTWQFVSGKVIAPADYSYCCLQLIYRNNVNTFSMTGAFCYREEFGQTYDYDDNGNVTSVVDLSNSKSSFAFKGDQMAKMLNPSGSEYFYSYNSSTNNLNNAVSTDGQRYSFTYDEKGNVEETKIEADKPVLTIEAGKHYIIRNAESGNVIDNGQTVGKVHNWRYSEKNKNQIWLVEATGETGVYYLKSIRENGYYMAVENNSNTNNASIISTATKGTGNAYKFKIQSNGDGTFTILTKTSNYTKCVDGQPNSSKDYSDKVKILQCTKNTNDESQKWYFFPDITTASGATQQDYISTSATHTSSGNFVSTMTDQRGNVTRYSYDEDKGTINYVTDAKGHLTDYLYNHNTNELVSVFRDGGSKWMENYYTYENDRLSEISVVGGTNYKFLYDSYGRTIATQVGKGTSYQNLSTLEYGATGQLNRQIYGNGAFIKFHYDNLDRLTEKSYNNSSTDKIQYQYGADGSLARTIDFSTDTETKYVYDLAGRLVGTKDYLYSSSASVPQLKASINYNYADKTNYLTGITHKFALGTQNIGYRYGNMANGEMPDQIYGVTWNGKQALNYTYDSLGRLTNKSLPLYGDDPYNETFDTTYTYYDVNDTKTTTLLKSLSSMGVTHTYEYDELGNITSIYDGSEYNTYEYDYLGQLVRENLGYEDKTYTYEYVNGNIKRKHEYAYTTGTLPSTPLRTTNYYYENSMWPDMLTKITETRYAGSSSSAYSLNNVSSTNTLAQTLFGNNYNVVDLKENAVVTVGSIHESTASNVSTYSTSSTKTLYTIGSDSIGNITNIGNVTVDWNGRRLESISQSGTELVSYEYNMDGQRTKKIVTDPTTGTTTTTEYFYNGSILAGQRTGNDEIVFMYDNNGDVFGFEYNGAPYYYVKNAQNDVYLIIDENGYAQVLYQYDAWGKVTYCIDATDFGLASKNPIMYRSYYVDLEMGMFIYYLNSRYYIADWGRFASADVLVSSEQGMLGYNLFAYCGNNPVNRSDTGGAFWDTLFDVVSLCTSIVDVMSNPKDPWAWAGLVGDVFDLAVPGLSGVGEVIKGARTAGKVVDGISATNKARKTYKTISNTYEVSNATRKATKSINLACFVAGTKISTADGLVNIENISPGDFVWAENPETGEKGLKQVVQTFVKEKYELVHIFVNGEEIVTTIEHPFYIPQKGWTSAIKLRAGDILVLRNGKHVVIEKVQHEILENPVTVYNFEVEDFHTYYVGNSSVLVHNDCGKPTRINQLKQQVIRGQAPREIKDIHKPHIGGQQPHIHFKDGTALNFDGTVHDKMNGTPHITNKILIWLEENGLGG